MAIQKQHTERKKGKLNAKQCGNTETTYRIEIYEMKDPSMWQYRNNKPRGKSENQRFNNMVIQKQTQGKI